MKKVIVCICALLLLVACGQKQESIEAPTWQEQYDLGIRYLSEGNYQEAILAFEMAVEIDPKRPETYISLADSHINSGSGSEALKVLQYGYEITKDNSIIDRIVELEKVVRTERINSDSGEVYWVKEYDALGRLVRETCYTDGTITYVQENAFDTNGVWIGGTRTNLDPESGGRTEFTVDEFGRITKEIFYWPSGVVGTQEYLYNGVDVTIRFHNRSTEHSGTPFSGQYTMSAENHQVGITTTNQTADDSGNSICIVGLMERNLQGFICSEEDVILYE